MMIKMDEAQKPESPLPKPNKSVTVKFRKIFVSCEKLRTLYILILASIVVLFVLVLHHSALTDIGFRVVVIEAAVIANDCFFAGPVESYLNWPWLDSGVRGVFRPVEFVIGTVASVGVALLVLFSFGVSTMDMG